MLKKILYVLSVLLSSFLLFIIMVKISPLSITSQTTQVAKTISDEHKNMLEDVYDVNFPMSKVPSGNTITFLPILNFTDYNEATEISELFNIKEDYFEDDEKYHFIKGSENLTVYKYGNRILYENDGEASALTHRHRTKSVKEGMTEKKAADICVQFIKRIFPDFVYEEAEVNFDGSIYEITFINRLANLKNYAFPTEAKVNSNGEILRLGYNYTDSEKLSSTKIKSMAEAYLELPLDLEENLKVDLKKCSLVYRYQNSVIQPVYMFEGEASGGKSFKCFVNASLYSY